MSLRRFVISLVISTFLFVAGGYRLLGGTVLGLHFDEMENTVLHDDLIRIYESLGNRLRFMAKTAADYGRWECTWDYVHQPNEKYRETNLNVWTMQNLGVERVLFFDKQLRLVRAFAAPLPGRAPDTSKYFQDLLESIPWSQVLRNDHPSMDAWIQSRDSLVWMVALSPITRNTLDSLVGGYLLLASRMDQITLDSLRMEVRQPLQLWTGCPLPSTVEVLDSLSGSFGAARLLGDRKRQENSHGPPFSRGYLCMGLGNSPALFVVDQPRLIESSGQHSLRLLFNLLLLSGGIILVLILLMTQKWVLHPLDKLEGHFLKIGDTGDFSFRVPVQGPREIR
ncbi:MAG TPA: CHASE4 domain-containing protein, partial [Fibrobacteraceae bacterium]|nr:CHASE4 domain-containing protein [Fibrobacteraceae bacterium]